MGVETHAITLMRFSEMISFRTYFLLESLVILDLCVCLCVCVCVFLAVLWGMWDLSPLPRDQTCTSWIGSIGA